MSSHFSEYFVRFGSARAHIIRPNMRMRNGMLHVIDATLYSDDPNASEWSAGARAQCGSISVVVIALFAAYLVTLRQLR